MSQTPGQTVPPVQLAGVALLVGGALTLPVDAILPDVVGGSAHLVSSHPPSLPAAGRHQSGGDRQRDLLRALPADVQAERRSESSELFRSEPHRLQRFHIGTYVPSAAHDPDEAGGRSQQGGHQVRDAGSVVVGVHGIGPRVHRDALERRTHLVGECMMLVGDPLGTRFDQDRWIAEPGGQAQQLRGDRSGGNHDERGGQRVRLDEHLDVAQLVMEHPRVRDRVLGRQRLRRRLDRGRVELRASERALKRSPRSEDDPRTHGARRRADLLDRSDRDRARDRT